MRIGLLEDDIDQANLTAAWLQEAGHNCQHFQTAKDFLRNIKFESFDLFILDWILPDMTGIQALQNLRSSYDDETPVIFATQMDDEKNVVQALESGADDYMIKPIRKLELYARINALGRRTGGTTEVNAPLEIGNYIIEVSDRRIYLNEAAVELTGKEYELAAFMFKNIGKVISRNHILENIWGMQDAGLTTRTVDVHISRLRKKLQLAEENGVALRSIYQHGYRLEKVNQEAGV